MWSESRKKWKARSPPGPRTGPPGYSAGKNSGPHPDRSGKSPRIPDSARRSGLPPPSPPAGAGWRGDCCNPSGRTAPSPPGRRPVPLRPPPPPCSTASAAAGPSAVLLCAPFIPEAPDRGDIGGIGGVVLDFDAQAADIHVHDLQIALVIPSPHGAQNVLPGQGPSGILHE